MPASLSLDPRKRGIGPCYSSKAIRNPGRVLIQAKICTCIMWRVSTAGNGVRFGDLLHFDEFERKVRDLTVFWRQLSGLYPAMVFLVCMALF